MAQISRSAAAVERFGDDAAEATANARETLDSVAAVLTRFGADTLPEMTRLLDELNVLAASMRPIDQSFARWNRVQQALARR